MQVLLTEREIQELTTRVRWDRTVTILEEDERVDVQARELGRSALLVEGELGLVVGRALTVECEIAGERFQILGQVEASILLRDKVVSKVRIQASSPRGNDLIASVVRRSLAKQAELPQAA